MVTSSIKISELNAFPTLLKTEDFFPIDKSSSLLTYKATLGQLQSLLNTGSFSGSFKGNLLGTSSVATSSISASYIRGANVTGSVLSSSYAVTASYVSGSGGSLSGAGTNTFIPIWTGNTTLGNSIMQYTASTIVVNGPALKVQNNYGQGFFSVQGGFNSNVILQSSYTASDAWTLAAGADLQGNDARGILELITYSGSNSLASKQSNPTPLSIVKVAQIISNGIYLWPLTQYQSVSSDATVTIGASYVTLNTASTLNTTARLQIFVYSGSSPSYPQTNHLLKAIEVLYGSASLSSSYYPVFCVSSSGQVVGAGFSGSTYNAIAFYGSASYATTASVIPPVIGPLNALGILSTTSSLTVNNYTGSSYSFSHNIGGIPFYYDCRLLCVSNDAVSGYVANDEINSAAVYNSSGSSAITSWKAPSNLGASCFNGNWFVNKKSDGSNVLLDTTLWKLKVYYR